jgi:hypothetical protein
MLKKSSTHTYTSPSLRTLLDPLEGSSAVLERRQLVGSHASLGVWCEYLGSGVHCSPSILPMSCVCTWSNMGLFGLKLDKAYQGGSALYCRHVLHSLHQHKLKYGTTVGP